MELSTEPKINIIKKMITKTIVFIIPDCKKEMNPMKFLEAPISLNAIVSLLNFL